MRVAQTILKQLGSHRFTAMTGAKNYVASENALTFSLPARFAKDRINKVRITLTPADTYTVEAWEFKRSTLDLVEKARVEDVYCDTLQETFTRITGLYTRL